MFQRAAALTLLALAPAASALDWKPSGELGLLAARGNSDTSSVNGKLRLKGEDAASLHELAVGGLYGQAGDAVNAQRFDAAASSGYKLSERSYVAGSVRYENDDFARYDHQAVTAASYGRVAIDDDTSTLKLEIGPGYRYAERAGAIEGDGVVRGKSDFRRKIASSAEVFNTLLVEGASENTFAQGDLGVQVAINASVALKAGLQVRHNTDAQPGVERTDTLTTVNLVWSPKR